jgi:hypothetical protein
MAAGGTLQRHSSCVWGTWQLFCTSGGKCYSSVTPQAGTHWRECLPAAPNLLMSVSLSLLLPLWLQALIDHSQPEASPADMEADMQLLEGGYQTLCSCSHLHYHRLLSFLHVTSWAAIVMVKVKSRQDRLLKRSLYWTCPCNTRRQHRRVSPGFLPNKLSSLPYRQKGGMNRMFAPVTGVPYANEGRSL